MTGNLILVLRGTNSFIISDQELFAKPIGSFLSPEMQKKCHLQNIN